MDPIKITVNFDAIFAWIVTIGYPALKLFSSYYITKRELQYPTWDREGVQIRRRLHHVVRSYVLNFVVNPEWAGLKFLAFIPVWLVSGKRFWNSFAPWRIKKAPVFCRTCQDRGKYYTAGFLAGQTGSWNECQECTPHAAPSKPNCTCVVCLDKGSIGPNRSCPHCERRRLIAEANTWEGVHYSCQMPKSL